MEAGILTDPAQAPPSHSEVVLSSPFVPPIHRLPVELLSEVFVELDLVQEDVSKQKPAVLYGPHLLAVTAACVCRKWRAVALSTHDLWTSIIVTDETRHIEAYIDACVTNSGLRGLELRCTSEKFLPTLLSRLLPHCARWAILSLDSAREADVAVLSREEYSFNCLKGFRLQSCCEILPGALIFLARAPLLSDLSIGEAFTDEAITIPPMHKLIHVSFHIQIEHPEPSIFEAIVPSHATLESLFLSFSCEASEIALVEPVLMPKLRCLDLDYICPIYLNCMIAPALERLVIIEPHPDSLPFDALFSFVSHPQANPQALRSLDLTWLPMHLDEENGRVLLRCLTLTTNLEDLRIMISHADGESPRVSDALYVGLCATSDSDASPILPRLRYLAWQVHCGGMTSSELGRYRAHLFAVVRSRLVPQDIAGQEFVALQSFATELEFPELGEKVKDRINSCIGRNTYLGKYGRG
ncbi:hypothetical protein EV714DRAFT_219921 [Schizophyllum commune]